VEPFRIHVADEVLDDLRARLRHTRWPDQVPGIGWEQGTELDWPIRLPHLETRENLDVGPKAESGLILTFVLE
jgi:hypothetical protein